MYQTLLQALGHVARAQFLDLRQWFVLDLSLGRFWLAIGRKEGGMDVGKGKGAREEDGGKRARE